MFNRTSKMTALLVAAAAVTSLVPASAAERLGTKDGTITNAIAFNGTYVYDGYRTDDDDAGLYFNNGKDKMVDEDEDYSYDDLAKYGSKYALIQDGNDDYLVDLSNGKILDDESVEDKEDNAKSKLYTNLKKADRYENAKAEKDRDNGITKFDRINTNQFGEVWYQYTAKGDETTGAGVEYTGFANESGKYIDITQDANLYVYNGNGKTVKVSEYNKDKDGIKAEFVNARVIAQDSDYIYTVTTVSISGAKDGFNGEQYFVQKISKAQGDKKDGAYLPKSVTSYQLDKTVFDDSDVHTAASLLIDGKDENYTVLKNGGVQAVKGNLYVTAINNNEDNVKVYNLKLKKTKLDTVKDSDKNYEKNVDTYIAISDADDDQDIVNGAVSIDAEGNTWALDKGKIYKFTGSDFKEMYTCDRSLDRLDVYNEKNLIAWDEDGDVYTSVNDGKAATDENDGKDDNNAEEVKAGWVTNQDGSWSYNKADGTKTAGWLLDGSNWYYFNANGIMQTGWVNVNGTWYYLNPVSNGFKGAMQTGWLNDNGTWYYLQSNGAMKTGWLLDGSNWYYLNANGSMAVNTTVDGYKVGANGAWIR